MDTANISSGEQLTYWIESSSAKNFATVSENLQTDVLVIGGGIAGLTTAYVLAKRGKNVVLVEDGEIGSGESGRTTAHITAALDDRYYEIEKVFGEAAGRKAAYSHAAATDFIEATVKEEGIDCDFERVNGYLFLHPSDDEKNLTKEYDATKRAGLLTQWEKEMPGINAPGPAICFPRQAQFHIMKYLHGLAAAIDTYGGKIFTHSHATQINHAGATCNNYLIKANHIVVATNSPVNNRVAIHTKQHPYRTYVIACLVIKKSLPHALWWDTGDRNSKWPTAPYHYVRLHPFDAEHDLLICGGEDHKTGQADEENISEEERYQRLYSWTKKHFPEVKDILFKWSGQVMEPVDYMAFIGKNPGDENIYIITGDSGNGITHGTLGGIIVPDLIDGKENEWADLYSPKRLPLKVPDVYFSEVFNMAKQYGDWISAGDIQEADDLEPGNGGIISKGFRKIAVYKNEAGAVQAFSAVCPHLGCILQWNSTEKSFDCPCHGSRFSKEGVVINGPANKNLESVEIRK